MDRAIMASSRPQAGHKRSKSSTAVFKSIIGSKAQSNSVSNGKENTTPPSTASASVVPISTPIWDEFNKSVSRRPKSQVAPPAKVPLNDRTIEQEISLHTPKDYSPSKKWTPALVRRERPKSVILQKSKSAISVFEAMTRTNNKESDSSMETERKVVAKVKTTKIPLKAEGGAEKAAKATRSASRDLLTMAKRGTRVMGLVAAFNKSSNLASEEAAMSSIEIEEAFEAVLESRNIPENMRKNLRMLKPTVKANLIKSNDVDFAAMAKPKSAPGSVKDKQGAIGGDLDDKEKETSPDSEKKTAKRSRPRSRTFTLSRSKKSKAEDGNGSNKSASLLKSTSSVSLDGRGSIDGGSSATPDEFVTYLHSEKSPQKLSIGKIHKLRQLLRNETVSWVEKFVTLGGLTEIVNLLHLIMKMEWREEHEDQLLHESLLCLKALCTTDSALKKISEIETTLFPALLEMLFDKERKGPSEYTTRGIIISVLLAHLKGAIKDPVLLPVRARAILGYLSDPVAEENELPFIATMRQSRPFKLWHQEVYGVSREVFWIYMHHHNIIALPAESEDSTTKYPDTAALEHNLSADQFLNAHFPRPRPPVPAAPYVGGVEWDATNYIATHLDLLNGLIAALPSKQERHDLRTQLRASYWEKTMGATLRTCKEKFYLCIHDALRDWVASAVVDGWDVRDVRMGPPVAKEPSPRKSMTKKKDDKAPVLDAPKLDLNLGLDNLTTDDFQDGEVRRWI